MTSGLALLARWSARQKLNGNSLVRLRRSVRACRQMFYIHLTTSHCKTDAYIQSL